MDKWSSYFDIYDKHIGPYQDKPVRLLEIGVSHGGSLQIWRKYLGEDSRIIGVDIDNRCADYAERCIEVIIADQSSVPQMQDIARMLGPFDIVIDDGSHMTNHQEVSFEALWPRTKGVYIVEDIHGQRPAIGVPGAFRYDYHWAMAIERPRRLIRGKPSRELRQDEIEAINLYGQI